MSDIQILPENSRDPEDFDLSQIFVGREEQLENFQIRLERWQQQVQGLDATSTQLNAPPSPNNRIQGLVVMLYGRGGFGKSTLLDHYRTMALGYDKEFEVAEIIDWASATENKRGFFNPAPGEQVEADKFFNILRDNLAVALKKDTTEFKEYKAAIEAVNKADKEAREVIENLQRDKRFEGLVGLTADGLLKAVKIAIPGSEVVLDNKKVEETFLKVFNKGVEGSAAFVAQVREKLHDRLRTALGDYLESSFRLARGLGRDLAGLANRRPLLICFDTYEEVDEADTYLRMVMGAAGARVGWVMAGRDNLWAGLGQRKRSPGLEYGYKDVVLASRQLGIDFSEEGKGDFTLAEIEDYFGQLCLATGLPEISREEANQITEVTLGVPLAVKIAAGLYRDTKNLAAVLEKGDGQREIVDLMVERYLLHTRIDEGEKAKLYALALLRRAERPEAIAAALNLTPQEAEANYEVALTRLHRRYSFIFTGKALPSLHEDVRHFLRNWLLEKRAEPDKKSLIRRLRDNHLADLETLDQARGYANLKERLEDSEWVGLYLDLVEQEYWLDPPVGLERGWPFILAATLYRPEAVQEAAKISEFFVPLLRSPYDQRWQWINDGFDLDMYSFLSDKKTTALQELVKRAATHCPAFAAPLPEGYGPELEAALWWQLGEAYRYDDDLKALEWYQKALTRLGGEEELKEAAASTAFNIGTEFYNRKEYSESLPYYSLAIELNPNYISAYNNRGHVYVYRNQYEEALSDYNQAIVLDPKFAYAYGGRGVVYVYRKRYEDALSEFNRAIQLDSNYVKAYNNRGYVYVYRKRYEEALSDFNRAIQLDPNYSNSYSNRGVVYAGLKQYDEALSDYDKAIQLDPNYTSALWMAEWTKLCLKRASPEMAGRLEEIAAIEPDNWIANLCQGVALGFRFKFEEGLVELEAALKLDLGPRERDAYFWQGNDVGLFEAGRRGGGSHSEVAG